MTARRGHGARAYVSAARALRGGHVDAAHCWACRADGRGGVITRARVALISRARARA